MMGRRQHQEDDEPLWHVLSVPSSAWISASSFFVRAVAAGTLGAGVRAPGREVGRHDELEPER